MSAEEPIIEIRNLHFAWENGHGRSVLETINLQLFAREAIALVGRSGCGKTTLCKLISGLLMPISGKITFRGMTVTGPRCEISLVFQDYPYFPWLTVIQNVMFGLQRNWTAAKRESYDRALSLLREVGLDRVASIYPNRLSGGMRQRLSIARALATQPDVLLLDEPFSALDLITKTEVISLLRRLQQEYNFGLFVVLHHLDDAVEVSDRVIVLSGAPATISAELNPGNLQFSDLKRLVSVALDNAKHRDT